MGYENYIPLGYDRLGRNCWGPKECAAFRGQIAADLVPVVARVKDDQAKRIGVDSLKIYDDLLLFPDGNAKPQGSPDDILAAGKEMYHELSPETKEFIDFLYDGELLDPAVAAQAVVAQGDIVLIAHGAALGGAVFHQLVVELVQLLPALLEPPAPDLVSGLAHGPVGVLQEGPQLGQGEGFAPPLHHSGGIKEIGTNFSLAYARHTIDTRDEFYEKESDYLDEIGPALQEMGQKIDLALLGSKFRPQLEEAGFSPLAAGREGAKRPPPRKGRRF